MATVKHCVECHESFPIGKGDSDTHRLCDKCQSGSLRGEILISEGSPGIKTAKTTVFSRPAPPRPVATSGFPAAALEQHLKGVEEKNTKERKEQAEAKKAAYLKFKGKTMSKISEMSKKIAGLSGATKAIIFGMICAGFLFYWFQIRPAAVRSYCAKATDTYYTDERGVEHEPGADFATCMSARGVKP